MESLVVAPVKYQNVPYSVAADKRQDTFPTITTENRLPGSEDFINPLATVPFMQVAFLIRAYALIRVKRKEPQSAAFFIRQMEGNGIARDNTANDCRRGTKKMTEFKVGCNLAGQFKEELNPVFFSLQEALRACESIFERCHVSRS